MFWNFPDGELLYKLELTKDCAIRNLFYLVDKDMIGAADCRRNVINLIKISSAKFMGH